MNPNDPDVIALSKAIIQHESGGNFDAVGDAGTSHGAAQWQPATWKAQAKDVLGDENAQMTPQNQKAVLQVTIAKRKAAGLNPAQIAAEWNSGQPNGWENKIGKTNINGQVISYNVPKYVKDVTDLYHQYKGQSGIPTGQPVNTPDASTGGLPQAPQQPQMLLSPEQDLAGTTPQPQDESLISKLQGRVNDFSGAGTSALSGKINPISGLLQTAGAVAGGIGDVTNAGLELIPGVKQVEGAIGQGAQALAQTAPGQAVVQGAQDFSAKHPELSADVGAIGNIVSAVPVLKGAGLVKDALGAGVKGALTGTTDAVYEAVAPKLGPKGLAKAITQQGTSQKGLLKKTVLNESPQIQKIAETVKSEVPGFNPNAPVTDQISQVQSVVDRKVEELKKAVVASGQDRIYSPNELRGVLNKIETPISLKGTPFEKQIGPLKKAVIEMAKEKGYKVSDLLDIRKEFDALVTRTWPNLYATESAPMRQAVRGIRDALTTFTEDRLPEGFGLKEALTTQSRLIKAIENMAHKAATGATKEIGTTSIGRFARQHPTATGLLKMTAKGAAAGVGFKETGGLIP